MKTSAEEAWPDRTFIESALRQANPNALRMALWQLTGDPAVAATQIELRKVRGGSMTIPMVRREDRETLVRLGLQYLASGPIDAVAPTMAQTEDLLVQYGAPAPTPSALRLAYEELAFDDQSRCAEWPDQPADEVRRTMGVLIVGAGISGIAMAIKLMELGLPYTIVERQAAIGGTWQLNDYPNARVDVTNFVYQFKAEKRRAWSSAFAGQAEIREYLHDVVEANGIAAHVKLSTTVESATWDETGASWIVVLRGEHGSTETLRARVLICATGLFSTPNLPDIAGLEQFGGRILHTTSWDHEYDLRGKRIGLIGTGSSGSQLMPHLAEEGSSLTVFQRTPNWVLPVDSWHATMTAEQHWLLEKLPFYWNWYCFANFHADLQIQPLQEFDDAWIAAGGQVSEHNDLLRAFLTAHVRKVFADRPDLIDQCLPDYPPTARRLVIDNGWYDGLLRPDVELVSTPIEIVDATGITTSDGRHHELDLIVLGSGFQTWRYLFPMTVTGRAGATPDELWSSDGARAYLGTMLPGFPNMFMFYGPNGQPRAGGFHGWAEMFSRYVSNLLIEVFRRDGASIEVTRDGYDQYNAALDKAFENKIWGQAGSGSYYLNEHGRAGVNMPWTVEELYTMLTEPRWDDFTFNASASADASEVDSTA